jgi:hypothetical protein
VNNNNRDMNNNIWKKKKENHCNRYENDKNYKTKVAENPFNIELYDNNSKCDVWSHQANSSTTIINIVMIMINTGTNYSRLISTIVSNTLKKHINEYNNNWIKWVQELLLLKAIANKTFKNVGSYQAKEKWLKRNQYRLARPTPSNDCILDRSDQAGHLDSYSNHHIKSTVAIMLLKKKKRNQQRNSTKMNMNCRISIKHKAHSNYSESYK